MPTLLFFVADDWGLFTHRIALARRAQAAGFHIGIVCRVTDHGSAIMKEGFDLYPLSHMQRGGRNIWQDLLLVWEVYKLYKRLRPDIVHHVAMKPVLYGTLAARLAGVRGIINALGGLGYVFTNKGILARFLKPLLSLAFKLILNPKRQTLILQNQDDISELFHITQCNNVQLIPGSGVDIKEFHPTDKDRSQDMPVALMAARLLWDKGVGDLIEAARILRKRNVPLHIQIVGERDSENPAAIPQQTLESWKTESNITFFGHRTDMPSLLRQADIGVLPSYREGLPKFLLEAGATGLPLIATNVPGCRDIVHNTVNGFLVPPKDPIALAKALEKLAKSVPLRHRMGKKSLARVHEKFSEEKINLKILELYKKVLAQT